MRSINAGVLELADETDSKSVVSNDVWVQVPPPAPSLKNFLEGFFLANFQTLQFFFYSFDTFSGAWNEG